MICKDIYIYISVKCINLIIFMLNQEKIYSTSQKNFSFLKGIPVRSRN